MVMKSLYLNAGKTQDFFNELKDSLSGELVSDNGEHNLILDTDFVKGNIEGISFPEGMTYLQFNLIFTDDVILSMEPLNNSPIFFAYCSEGALKHSKGLQGEKRSLKKYHTGILKSATQINNILYFEKNIPLKFSIIGIGTNKTSEDSNDILVGKLKKTFFNKKDDLMHVRSQNFKITEKLEEFNSITQKGIVRNLLKKGILKIILAMEIEQHSDSFVKMFEAITCLTLKQIDEIKRVSNFIMNFPAEGFTIKFLTQRSVASPNKLQEGFKLINNQR